MVWLEIVEGLWVDLPPISSSCWAFASAWDPLGNSERIFKVPNYSSIIINNILNYQL